MVRTVTMADLMKSKGPPSPKDHHRDNVGKGNYNRWDPLDENRPRLNSVAGGKRPLEGSPSAPSQVSKTIRLDPNKLFQDMQVHEEKLAIAKVALEEAKAMGDEKDIFNAGPMGHVLSKMLLVISTLTSHQEALTSAVIDYCKVNEKQALNGNGNSESAPSTEGGRGRSSTVSGRHAKNPPTASELQRRKIKQEINKAERSTILFDLDLGSVPIINKDTLSAKVTHAIHAAASKGPEISNGNYTMKEAEVMLDDILTCASLDFLGNGSKKFYNQREKDDSRNGKFCTVPAKLTFKTKEDRIRAEQSIRKLCKVRCSVPYPKKLRGLVNNLIQEGRKKSPGNYIQVKIDTDNMKLTARASVHKGNNKYEWEELDMDTIIPEDVLDKVVVARDEEEESMESQVS